MDSPSLWAKMQATGCILQVPMIQDLIRRLSSSRQSGFTMLELVVVLVLVAIVMLIMAPAFTSFINRQHLNRAQQSLYQAIRLSQNNAMQEKREWRFSIREGAESLEWAIHPNSVAPAGAAVWTPLHPALIFDLEDTTLAQAQGTYYVRFNFRGDVTYRLGRVTLMAKDGGDERRCVIVSTLIGAMRLGENQPTPDSNGRFCY